MIARTTWIFLALLVSTALLAARPAVTEIDKFNWISDHFATGGQPTVAQIASLKQEGFRTIVNLREPSEYDAAAEEAAAKEHGLAYVNIPVKKDAPKTEQVDVFLKLVNEARPPVFIHCATANRVAAFWMIRRVLADKWDVGDAEREAKVAGLKTENMKEFALDYIRRHVTK
ncbi:MAG TPA: protein tyrosine phosphatase family protein [Thermoanaerobaculia bacterium]|jgi:uncharacterized protein (TIGR01244 family)